MESLLAPVRAILEVRLPARGRILAGVSGGADSVALLHLTLAARPDLRPRLVVVHVHHGMRGLAADRDERAVRDLASRLGLPCTVYRGRAAGRLPEEVGRRLRLECLMDAARIWGATAVLLAHHRDDRVETLLFNLLRGTAGAGLAVLPESRSFPHPDAPPNLRLIRPLLPLSKEQVLGLCRKHRWAWRQDASNRDTAYTRNRIRRQLLPWLETHLNPQVRAALARLAEQAAVDQDLLDRLARRWLGRVVVMERSGAALRVPLFRRMPPALRRRVLSRVWDRLGIPRKTHAHLARLERMAGGGQGGADLPGGWRVLRTGPETLLRLRPPAAGLNRTAARPPVSKPAPGPRPRGKPSARRANRKKLRRSERV